MQTALSPPVPFGERDRADLARAVALLEHPSLAARLTALVGAPIERSLNALPAPLAQAVHHATQQALAKALAVGLRTLADDPQRPSHDRAHQWLSGASGALGGFFGAPALALELPVATTLMLRAIAAIARSEGEVLATPAARLACLEVFAIGGSARQDDAAESGYYAVRLALAGMVTEAASYIAERGTIDAGAPALARLIGAIASRFGVGVSHKAAAQLVPVVGALGGATVNMIFMDHFQTTARGHFTVRRLERVHGAEPVRLEYRRLRGLN